MAMDSMFWSIFGIATAFKLLLMPAYHSTDFEVHRNWLAITHTLPLRRWYYDATSEWTLDYPPFFAYFEWLLSQVARYVEPQMLLINNKNYASERAKNFQRCSVIFMDIIYALGVWRCLRVLRISKLSVHHFVAEILLLLNIGLLFVDHIHFQYNGFLFGILLLSISFLLEERYPLAAFTFATLLNFKHIFLYMAPAFAVYFLKFYCMDAKRNTIVCTLKLLASGLLPFVLSFGPFWQDLPQLFKRLFPFKRGLTHAYWAPNFWAIYNTADKVASVALRVPRASKLPSTTSGLVQEFEYVVLPSVKPSVTFILTALFMLPVLVRLIFYTSKSESHKVFLRSLVLCACTSFMFGWHVHEKAILMCLIPLCLLCLIDPIDAKYAFMLSIVGYFSLFPLLFHVDLLLIRYSMYMAYICFMYSHIVRMHKAPPDMHILEDIYSYGFILLPLYEHIVSPILGLNEKLPFMPLLLTSFYCSVGVLYIYIRYYLYTLDITFTTKLETKSKTKPNTKTKLKFKSKTKQKLQ